MDSNTAKVALLTRLGQENTEFFVLMSACTREPYVQCDGETFDDEVLLFFDEEKAKAKGMELAGEKIPVNLAKLESKQMLTFFTTLYTMGVNALRVYMDEENASIQIEEIVKKRDQSEMPDGSRWIENPQLHLTCLYFAQELRKPATESTPKRLAELQEELSADFQKGTYIFALSKDGNGTPMIKMKNELKYQPVFTDVIEFQRFNREQVFKPVVVENKNLLKVLDKTADGVVLNCAGVNLPLTVNRPKVQPGAQPGAAGAGDVAAQAGALAGQQPMDPKEVEKQARFQQVVQEAMQRTRETVENAEKNRAAEAAQAAAESAAQNQDSEGNEHHE